VPPVAMFHDKSGRYSTEWCKSGAKALFQGMTVTPPQEILVTGSTERYEFRLRREIREVHSSYQPLAD
jgi:hypothetical protein